MTEPDAWLWVDDYGQTQVSLDAPVYHEVLSPLFAATPEAITDDMVDRACRSFIPNWEKCAPAVKSDCVRDMRSALVAALLPTHKPLQEEG